MRGGVLARVLASRSSKAQAGDLVYAMTGWREIAIASEKEFEPPLTLPAGVKPRDLLGVLGMSGLTAYFGMFNIGDPRPGETVVVSGAAGATGSVAGQLAKIKGARVIGIAGSDDKVRWLKEELGFDDALNYKDPDFKKKFKEATPKFIDVFWDNGMLHLIGDSSHVLLTRNSWRRTTQHGAGTCQQVRPIRHVRRHQPVQQEARRPTGMSMSMAE